MAAAYIFVDEGKRLTAVSLSIAGGIAQLIITVMAGLLWNRCSSCFSKEEIVLDMGLLFFGESFFYG